MQADGAGAGLASGSAAGRMLGPHTVQEPDRSGGLGTQPDAGWRRSRRLTTSASGFCAGRTVGFGAPAFSAPHGLVISGDALKADIHTTPCASGRANASVRLSEEREH